MAEHVDRDSVFWVDSYCPQYTVYVDEMVVVSNEVLDWVINECAGTFCHKWVAQQGSCRLLLAVTFTDEVSATAFKLRWC
jgi:hypothetical protein